MANFVPGIILRQAVLAATLAVLWLLLAFRRRSRMMLAAGLDGIKKGARPPKPVNQNIYNLSAEESKKLKVGALPHNLDVVAGFDISKHVATSEYRHFVASNGSPIAQQTHFDQTGVSAGVRYSLINPHAYTESNIEGFMNILEGCRHAKIEHLVYASSSSVYGGNEVMPFREADKAPEDVLNRILWHAMKGTREPYPIWAIDKSGPKVKQALVAAPEDAANRLRYYYTYRFMSFATGNLFPDSARQLKEHDIWLYAMQGPTPSWNGSSLDWHEFYDTGANTALVFETSNRDARSWQWESYLSDIMRGISKRHGGMPIGCLVKPHRGAPSQRMLSVVSRGARALEWYTYGPDYSKGDSFSQSPELLEEVARAARFLAKAELCLWNAKYAVEPEVAFVFPRSSEIWGRVGPLGATALENAKWVYLALRHEHIPVDILSEQQLAE